MNHFQAFCQATPKNEHGYVPDLLDMDESAKDKAVVSFLLDIGSRFTSSCYLGISNAAKNEIYASIEIVMQDEVDKFNQAIDNSREVALLDDHTMISLCDPEYKWQHFNQALWDAGHNHGDFA